MSEYAISQVHPTDRRSFAQIDALLEQEGIKRDSNLDYTCAMFDEDYQVIATGSCFANTCGVLPSAAPTREKGS